MAWAPSVQDVARHLTARTKDDNGAYVGTFNNDTRPTADQVQALIDTAVALVRGMFTAADVPEEVQAQAKEAATLKAALSVELSYFPEQAQDNSPYLQLRALSDQAMQTLIARATALDMFGEDPEPVNILPSDGAEV
jgi:hypothetical protein